MSVLLDTHIWLWWLLGAERLDSTEMSALDRLADRGDLHLSAMSLWEAQMLHSKGRLTLDRPFPIWLREASREDILQVLPLDLNVVIALNELPDTFHGDPADRLIVATALVHGLPLATYDGPIRRSGVIPIWNADDV